ncbi:DUF5000 domain-containing lipoprotein [Compostibacter hankyongensis]|uniref:DUF5000 domain-containing lipoprotein n=1 Tax=Compostibacter hankyongensis TaxID=1007089 RepID=A0ABP8FIQ7_9BACT
MYKYLLIAVMILLAGCQGDEKMTPVNKNDAVPDQVSNVHIKNLPGGAKISYNVPKSENLLYVKALYEIRKGTELEVKSSYYNNSLTIQGFPDTSEYEVKLYTVTRGEVASEPLTIKVKPLTPPITTAFRSLALKETFGGLSVGFKNESEADIVLTVLTPDSLGDLYPAEVYYTKRDSGVFAARGFEDKPRKFGVFVRDRWNNHSDTLYTEVTPLFEEEMDKTKFKAANLPTDTYTQHCCGTGMSDIWDDNWNGGNAFHTKPSTGLPQWFTFDMGVSARLSRFKFYHRKGSGAGTDGAFYSGDPKIFEIWGSNDPSSDGSWDNWVLLGHFEAIKPSGQATPTTEDIQYACVDGEDFEFGPDIPKVRYLRFKTLQTWGTDYIYIAELTFWGNTQ